MTRFVAFLRAVNVAGHARAKMSDVRDVFVAAGGANVSTFLPSGNIVFESRSRDAPKVAANARQALATLLGEEPEIMVRPLQRLADLVGSSPFRGVRAGPRAKLYVVFLAGRPRHSVEFPLTLPAEALEAIGMEGHEVFVVSRAKKNGFYGFPNAFIEKALGVAATSRNWSTVTRLVGRD